MLTETLDYSDLQCQVGKMVAPAPCRMIFSMFESVSEMKMDGSWLVKAPDLFSTRPIWSGPIRFVIDYWRFGNEKRVSPTYSNPTWKDLIQACNELMLTYGDGDGVYFEGTKDPQDTPEMTGLRHVELVIGS